MLGIHFHTIQAEHFLHGIKGLPLAVPMLIVVAGGMGVVITVIC